MKNWLFFVLYFAVCVVHAQQFLLGEWVLEPFQRTQDSVYVFSGDSWYFSRIDQQLYAGRVGDMGAVNFVKLSKNSFRIGKNLVFDYNPSTQRLTHTASQLRYYKKDMQENFWQIFSRSRYIDSKDSTVYLQLDDQGRLKTNWALLQPYQFVRLERHTFSPTSLDVLSFYASSEEALEQPSKDLRCYSQLILVYFREKIQFYKATCIEESFSVPSLRQGELLAELKALPHHEKIQN